jgi:transposase
MGPHSRAAVKLLLQNGVPFRCIAATVSVSLGFISKCKKELEGKKTRKAAQGAPHGRGRPRTLTACRCTFITIGVHTYFTS